MTRRAIEELVAPLCAGQDATRIGPLMREVQERLQVFGRGGTVIHALSAVDIALWDIAGKAAGLPLHRLLGGGASRTWPATRASTRYGEPARVREGVRQALDAGFGSVKLHEREVPAVRAAREEAGPGRDADARRELPLDSSAQARARAAELRDARLAWLEEPLWPPEDYDGLARPARRMRHPARRRGERAGRSWTSAG